MKQFFKELSIKLKEEISYMVLFFFLMIVLGMYLGILIFIWK